jgi:hypothetical protein
LAQVSTYHVALYDCPSHCDAESSPEPYHEADQEAAQEAAQEDRTDDHDTTSHAGNNGKEPPERKQTTPTPVDDPPPIRTVLKVETKVDKLDDPLESSAAPDSDTLPRPEQQAHSTSHSEDTHDDTHDDTLIAKQPQSGHEAQAPLPEATHDGEAASATKQDEDAITQRRSPS